MFIAHQTKIAYADPLFCPFLQSWMKAVYMSIIFFFSISAWFRRHMMFLYRTRDAYIGTEIN
jgi:hypothetical protein